MGTSKTASRRTGSRTVADDPVLITDARLARSQDIEMRQRRYVMTMIIRTTCFCTMFFVPGWWKIVAISAAAVLPAIAVVLANARDNRTYPGDIAQPDDEAATMLALAPGPVIRGEVDETH